MRIFDKLFNKKEPQYDSNRITIHDLKTGFVFDYDLRSWQVLNTYKYDWGNHYFSYEYKISDGKEICFLTVEEDDELHISISRKIKLLDISKSFIDQLIENQEPPKQIDFNRCTYSLAEKSPGYFKNLDNKKSDWEEFISWEFASSDQKSILCIEQWDKEEFEASLASPLKEFEVNNILPSEHP